jgi:tetratricopeptide (TPR) repeat protein
MLELVKLWGVETKLHTAYYMLGQAALLFHEYEQAENFFFKALRYFKGSKAEKGSWKYHWAKALYMLGQKKKALLAFAASVNEIKKNALPKESFLAAVYLSGAYMNFSFVLAKDGKLEDARRYFNLAKELVSEDKRLVVRREQLRKLALHFKSLEKM